MAAGSVIFNIQSQERSCLATNEVRVKLRIPDSEFYMKMWFRNRSLIHNVTKKNIFLSQRLILSISQRNRGYFRGDKTKNLMSFLVFVTAVKPCCSYPTVYQLYPTFSFKYLSIFASAISIGMFLQLPFNILTILRYITFSYIILKLSSCPLLFYLTLPDSLTESLPSVLIRAQSLSISSSLHRLGSEKNKIELIGKWNFHPEGNFNILKLVTGPDQNRKLLTERCSQLLYLYSWFVPNVQETK